MKVKFTILNVLILCIGSLITYAVISFVQDEIDRRKIVEMGGELVVGNYFYDDLLGGSHWSPMRIGVPYRITFNKIDFDEASLVKLNKLISSRWLPIKLDFRDCKVDYFAARKILSRTGINRVFQGIPDRKTVGPP
jgi:hypothetical protein